MWPFKRKPKVVEVPPQQISFSQLDITETFDDNLTLKSDDWIDTIPLNNSISDPASQGLPAVDASDDVTYEIGDRLSGFRESFLIPGDGSTVRSAI